MRTPAEYLKAENWKGSLYCFHLDMEAKLVNSVPEKGEPTKDRLKDCSVKYLTDKLMEHLTAGNYADVANFAFLLYQAREGAELQFISNQEVEKQ